MDLNATEDNDAGDSEDASHEMTEWCFPKWVNFPDFVFKTSRTQNSQQLNKLSIILGRTYAYTHTKNLPQCKVSCDKSKHNTVKEFAERQMRCDHFSANLYAPPRKKWGYKFPTLFNSCSSNGTSEGNNLVGRLLMSYSGEWEVTIKHL